MEHLEFRAYDRKGKSLIYDKELWLPQGLSKLGYTEHPVHISQSGIHYTLDCLSDHYPNDWEEHVIACLDIDVMPSTNRCDSSATPQMMYCHDIISFYRKEECNNVNSQKLIGQIQFSDQTGDWIIVDLNGRFMEMLSHAEQPRVLGNWFEHPELLC